MKRRPAPITPGEILLEEFMVPLGISRSELAEAICTPPNRIGQIINGKREITADTALRLGRFFGIEPEFWLNLQTRYNVRIAEKSLGRDLDKIRTVSFDGIHGHPHVRSHASEGES